MKFFINAFRFLVVHMSELNTPIPHCPSILYSMTDIRMFFTNTERVKVVQIHQRISIYVSDHCHDFFTTPEDLRSQDATVNHSYTWNTSILLCPFIKYTMTIAMMFFNINSFQIVDITWILLCPSILYIITSTRKLFIKINICQQRHTQPVTP